jgi:basic membrane lipoprotein Med (substrate-binding protein (PBP1-ABC) superfamily)
MIRNLLLSVFATAVLSVNGLFAADAKPTTVIHVITVKWKSDATPAQIEKAVQTAQSLPSQYSGITHVWTKAIKKQIPEGYNDIIVMEFASQDALKKYVDSPAQKKFYEVYMPIREESRTSDISN